MNCWKAFFKKSRLIPRPINGDLLSFTSSLIVWAAPMICVLGCCRPTFQDRNGAARNAEKQGRGRGHKVNLLSTHKKWVQETILFSPEESTGRWDIMYTLHTAWARVKVNIMRSRSWIWKRGVGGGGLSCVTLMPLKKPIAGTFLRHFQESRPCFASETQLKHRDESICEQVGCETNAQTSGIAVWECQDTNLLTVRFSHTHWGKQSCLEPLFQQQVKGCGPSIPPGLTTKGRPLDGVCRYVYLLVF